MIEKFYSIPGYEGLYEISKTGDIKSLSRIIGYRIKGKTRVLKEKILKKGINSAGYYLVTLYKYKKAKSCNVHKLMAITFLDHIPCGSKLVVNHIDTNKLNNNLENLEMVTTRVNSNLKHIKHTSIYTGVYKFKNKWKASIHINGKTKNLGTYSNEIDAHFAYENEFREVIKPIKKKP